MANLPDAATLARLVSNVTQTMCNTTFAPLGDPLSRGESLCGTMVLLPLTGPRKISIVLACDSRSSRRLGAALFGCKAEEINGELATEAVNELLNMIGGQVTRALHIDQALGLPRRTNLAEIASEGGISLDETVLLRSHGEIDLRLWIFEHHAEAPGPSAPRKGWLRSLLRKASP